MSLNTETALKLFIAYACHTQSGSKPGDLSRLSISVLENVVQTVCINVVERCMR